MKITRTLLVITASLLLTACGITAPRSGPGYADLQSPGVWDTDRQFSLSIGPTVMRFAARHIDDDPQTVALLRSLDGVRIRIYEIDGDTSRVADRMDLMQDDLSHQGWEPVMIVREGDERTHMMIKQSDGQVHGLTMLSSDGYSEAVVINLIGDIQPEMFSDVMIALDVDDGGAHDVVIADNTDSDQGAQQSPISSM